MGNLNKKNLIILVTAIVTTIVTTIITTMSVQAESLFTLGTSQTYAAAPKSLYGGVQARTVGDLISIIMSENVSMADSLSYTSSKTAKTVDNFTGMINTLIGKDVLNNQFNNFGGSNEVETKGKTSRAMSFGDTVAVQVVQQMPNGNLVVQGKKTLVSGNERMDMIVTGVVDPRWINALGQVYSRNVANLQFALSGRGSVSRSENEGIINRFIKYLF